MNEKHIEDTLIEKLIELKYTYRPDIRDRQALELNFRQKFEALNRVRLSDSEFNRLRDEIISTDVFTASQHLRQMNTFRREDDTPLHYSLVNIKDWCKNDFEVVNQLRMNTNNSHHRYDVILLINGIPVVQIELKKQSVEPRTAMEQIVKYKNDVGNGYTNSLLCFMQLFIVSNQYDTYYFSNNNKQHFTFNAYEQFLPVYKYANEDNSKVDDLGEFADKFLSKCTLAQMISRYMVLVVTESKMMVMRPYQIYAVKAIVDSIHENRGNGYIWHTTGSGKTLTSFKASTLLKDNDDIEKCLFVVDRKDLDEQTRKEFNKFQENCVEDNTHTASLVSRLLSDDKKNKVLVSTIQKLALALDPNRKDPKSKVNYRELLAPLSKKRLVFIFDECHRSQFGDNHRAIKDFFPNAQLFGFTGTPIFEKNATVKNVENEEQKLMMTEDIFQNPLHKYTITHAIADKNVLPFHIDYFKPDGKNPPKAGETLAKKAVVEAILKKHDTATDSRRFNAILATAKIDDAIEYYNLFKTTQAKRLADDERFRPLNIACVFSPPVAAVAKDNDNDKNIADLKQLQGDLEQEKADNQVNPEEKKKALESIIADFNAQYNTNHRIHEFDSYYKDIQQRIKFHKYPNADYPHKNKIDVLIVVDMLLTGFDAQYLNTLYVDKNLRFHGLIQAFSRTNRTLNSTKKQGNILDFRNQQNEVDAAMLLFSGEKTVEAARQVWEVPPAAVVIKDYEKAISDLDTFMQSKGLACKPSELSNLVGTIAKTTFIEKFKEVQKLKNQLDQYTDLTPQNEEAIEKLLPSDFLQEFRTKYLRLAKELSDKTDDKTQTDPNQLNFEFVLFASALIDEDYILGLWAKSSMQTPAKQRKTREEIIALVESDAKFENKREDLIAYFNSHELNRQNAKTIEEIKAELQTFIDAKDAQQLADIAAAHGLETAALQAFVQNILSCRVFDGDKLSDLLAPLELGWKVRAQKEMALMLELIPILKHRAAGHNISGLSAYEK
jgi:type I restriction enzyme R subunit